MNIEDSPQEPNQPNPEPSVNPSALQSMPLAEAPQNSFTQNEVNIEPFVARNAHVQQPSHAAPENTSLGTAPVPIASPFHPATFPDWASDKLQRYKLRHTSFIRQIAHMVTKTEKEYSPKQLGVIGAVAATALLAAGCSVERPEGTVPTIEQSTTAETPTKSPEVKEKEIVQKDLFHAFVTIGPKKDVAEVNKISLEASQEAAVRIKESTRDLYQVNVNDAGAYRVSLTDAERAIFADSQNEPGKARELLGNKLNEAFTNLIGDEAIAQSDGVIATVDIDVDALYLEGSAVEGEPPINTTGMWLDMGTYPAILSFETNDSLPTKQVVAVAKAAHELGHTLVKESYAGLGHANLVDCSGVVDIPAGSLPVVIPNETCSVREYANKTDIMGDAGYEQDWKKKELFSALQLNQMNVLNPDEVVTIAPEDIMPGKTLQYTLRPLANGPEGEKLLLIPIGGDRPPIKDTTIPEKAKFYYAIYNSPEYGDFEDGEDNGKFANYSLKIVYYVIGPEGDLLSTYAIPLSPYIEDTNEYKDIGAPPKYKGVLLEDGARKISATDYIQNGKKGISVEITAQ